MSERPILVDAIAARALRTPSGDNVQPWRLRVDGTSITVELDPARVGASHVHQLAGVVSVGAFAESLRLEAGRRGHASTLVFDESHHAVRVTLGEGATADAELGTELATRRTVRGPYAPTALLHEEASALEAEGAQAARVTIARRRAEIAAVANASAVAERIRFESTDAMDLFRWLRFAPSEAAKTRDGLDVRLLALAPHERLGLRLTGSRSVLAAMRSLGAGRLAGRRLAKEIRASGAVGAIALRDDSEASLVECGRTLMRVWLRATRFGLAFAPVTVGALLPLIRRRGERFSADVSRRLEAVEQSLLEAFGVAKGTIGFVFRVGVARTDGARSLRRPLSTFLAEVA